LLIEQNIFNSLKILDRGNVVENGRIMLSEAGLELLENSHTGRRPRP
jgi:branched-chain amino acid transport system ATP-binding protein